ncbi:hypothetical protein [Candidatus Methylomicrobium oryzae]|uniref:hypothetical protein n=1 Tax=Candidatus Methylomicrobium oryzae TaxID=2802053 RepID=UPI0019205D02|nr:hypothetical protein [Methylomicrobium sp. RS1]
MDIQSINSRKATTLALAKPLEYKRIKDWHRSSTSALGRHFLKKIEALLRVF